jgi:hypothetical protein
LFLNCFDVLMSKIIFLKKIKNIYYFNTFPNKSTLKIIIITITNNIKHYQRTYCQRKKISLVITCKVCFRLRLFFPNFCVCGETNATRCLVINHTAFCTAGPTKKMSLKCSFCEAIFTCFFN